MSTSHKCFVSEFTYMFACINCLIPFFFHQWSNCCTFVGARLWEGVKPLLVQVRKEVAEVSALLAQLDWVFFIPWFEPFLLFFCCPLGRRHLILCGKYVNMFIFAAYTYIWLGIVSLKVSGDKIDRAVKCRLNGRALGLIAIEFAVGL